MCTYCECGCVLQKVDFPAPMTPFQHVTLVLSNSMLASPSSAAANAPSVRFLIPHVEGFGKPFHGRQTFCRSARQVPQMEVLTLHTIRFERDSQLFTIEFFGTHIWETAAVTFTPHELFVFKFILEKGEGGKVALGKSDLPNTTIETTAGNREIRFTCPKIDVLCTNSPNEMGFNAYNMIESFRQALSNLYRSGALKLETDRWEGVTFSHDPTNFSIHASVPAALTFTFPTAQKTIFKFSAAMLKGFGDHADDSFPPKVFFLEQRAFAVRIGFVDGGKCMQVTEVTPEHSHTIFLSSEEVSEMKDSAVPWAVEAFGLWLSSQRNT